MNAKSPQNLNAPKSTGVLLIISTLVAAMFVAVQALYARVAYVEVSETRLLESKLDACFDNFDAAQSLDTALRVIGPGAGNVDDWPPKVVVSNASQVAAIKVNIVPMLNALEGGLMKASILGPLDKERSYLMQHLGGLSERLLKVDPTKIGDDAMDRKVGSVFTELSEFLGAQYLVIAGCRLLAERKS